MEFSGIELLVPALVTGAIIALRQFTAKLDGPAAYWWSIGLNIVAQVAVALTTGAEGADPAVAQAAMVGLGTGAVVSPGLAAAGKRIGAGKAIKPRS